LCSRTASAADRDSIFAISRPHDPITGFRTQGYPNSSMLSMAASFVNATSVAGVGTSARSRARLFLTLFAQMSAVSAPLTTGMS
jgi:hypothetical protein